MWRKQRQAPPVEPEEVPAVQPMGPDLLSEVLDEVRVIRTMASALRHVDRVQLAAQAICEIAVEQLGAPLAAVNLIAHEQMTIAGVGTSGDCDLDASYCKHVVAAREPLAIENSLEHPLVAENVATIRDGLRSYLGVPLRTEDDFVIGALCVCDCEPRSWSGDDMIKLTMLSQRLMNVEASALREEMRL